MPPGRLKEALDLFIGAGKTGSNPGGQIEALTGLLEARCARKPLVALLDEAHTLDPEVGKVLLNSSQKVRARAPFLLVLAGTPGHERAPQQYVRHVLEPL